MAKNPLHLVSKCQNFLSTLIRLAADETTKTASNVKNLIQNLIDGVIEPEEFSTQLQKELQCNHQPYLTYILKKSLYHVQQALISGEMRIEGIHPPPVPASMQSLVSTTQVSKCQDFLSTLIRLAGHETASNVKNLVQNLIDGVIEAEEFLTQLPKELPCHYPPHVVIPFLKRNLPHVRQALISGEMTMEEIRPPSVPACMQSLVPTIQSFLPPKNESQADSPLIGNIQSSDSIPVPADNGAEPSTLMPQPKSRKMLQDVTSDIELGKEIAKYLETNVAPKRFKKPFSKPEVAHVMHIRNFRQDDAINKKLKKKLKCLCKDNSSNLTEFKQLHHDAWNLIKKEREKKILRKITTFNNCCVELKTVWAGDGCVSYLPADKRRSAATSKDAFDLSSLNECLPSEPGDIEAEKKVKKIVKNYLSYEEKLRRFFRRSEILRILASASKQNKMKSSVSSKRSITRMVKKVYGDVKNVRIFSFRPVLENGKEMPGKRMPLNDQSNKFDLLLGQEKIILLKSPYTRNVKTKNDILTDKNASDLNSKPANLRNPERLLFNRDQRDDECHGSASRRKQEIQDSISLCRQLSRLKITNSKRAGISEDVSESEIQKACKDQNKDKQEKAAITIRKKQVVEILRKEHQRHRANTTTDRCRCAEDKDVVRTINSTYYKPDSLHLMVKENMLRFKVEPILPSLFPSLSNANLAPTPGGSGSIFPSTPCNPMMPITSSADPFIGPQLQKNELEELME